LLCVEVPRTLSSGEVSRSTRDKETMLTAVLLPFSFFLQPDDVKRHFEIEHGPQCPIYPCNACSKVFSRGDLLTRVRHLPSPVPSLLPFFPLPFGISSLQQLMTPPLFSSLLFSSPPLPLPFASPTAPTSLLPDPPLGLLPLPRRVPLPRPPTRPSGRGREPAAAAPARARTRRTNGR
jgi:hypothetical protein